MTGIACLSFIATDTKLSSSLTIGVAVGSSMAGLAIVVWLTARHNRRMQAGRRTLLGKLIAPSAGPLTTLVRATKVK
jgi:hypothetical protein